VRLCPSSRSHSVIDLSEVVDQLAGTSDYASVINTAFDSQRYHLDNEESFDDVQWVSIAYGRADDGANQVKYYDIASTGLDSTYCGGGVFWSGGRDYKNAITSELYMTTSGYLWDKTGDSKYLTALQDSTFSCGLLLVMSLM